MESNSEVTSIDDTSDDETHKHQVGRTTSRTSQITSPKHRYKLRSQSTPGITLRSKRELTLPPPTKEREPTRPPADRARHVTGDTIPHVINLADDSQDEGEESNVNLVHQMKLKTKESLQNLFNQLGLNEKCDPLVKDYIFTLNNDNTSEYSKTANLLAHKQYIQQSESILNAVNSLELINDFGTPNTMKQALKGKDK
jgi:hypothetical protein